MSFWKSIKKAVHDAGKFVPGVASIKLQKKVIDSTGSALIAKKISPKVAKLRDIAGTAGATAIVGGLVVGAVGGLSGAAATAAPGFGQSVTTSGEIGIPVGEGPASIVGGTPVHDFFSSISDTLKGISNAAAGAKGLYDQFGAGTPNAPAAYSQAPLQGPQIPTGLIIGGALALVLIVLLTRK